MILTRPYPIFQNVVNPYLLRPLIPIVSTQLLVNIPFTIQVVNEKYEINYNMTINNGTNVYENNIQLTSNKLIQIITALLNDLLNILCNNVPNNINNQTINLSLQQIDNKYKKYQYLNNGNNSNLYDINEIKGIYVMLYNYEYSKLCQAYKSINNFKTNVNITQYGGNCININLFVIKKYDIKCNCRACNNFENMTMELFNSIKNNDLNGVIKNLIPSFMSKHDFHLLYKLSEPFLDKYHLPYFQ